MSDHTLTATAERRHDAGHEHAALDLLEQAVADVRAQVRGAMERPKESQ